MSRAVDMGVQLPGVELLYRCTIDLPWCPRGAADFAIALRFTNATAHNANTQYECMIRLHATNTRY